MSVIDLYSRGGTAQGPAPMNCIDRLSDEEFRALVRLIIQSQDEIARPTKTQMQMKWYLEGLWQKADELGFFDQQVLVRELRLSPIVTLAYLRVAREIGPK